MINEKAFESIISRAAGELGQRIEALKQGYLQAWWQTEAAPPSFLTTYTLKEQQAIEQELSGFMERVVGYSERYLPAAEPQGLDFSEPIAQTRMYVKKLFGLAGIEIDDAFTDGIVRSTTIFIDRVKNFDPAMSPENIYQALRNIWIMNTLQVYFGMETGCSDSMFAYSMLYPYTDNIMDDAATGPEEKMRSNDKLRLRLEGRPYFQPAGIEKKLDRLVELVEQEFPRDRFPQVFQGLLGIYNAQIKSLAQQNGDVPPHVVDIPGVSFEKGGTSVLADGYLVKGKLTGNQEAFCFGLGAFLQLADDIQDVVMDKKNNHTTLFSQAAGRWKMDALANKLFRLIPVVVPGDKEPRLKKIDELFHRSFHLHIMEAVGKNAALYSDAYIKELQVHFPVRFSYLKKLRKKLKKIHRKQAHGTFNLDVVSAGLMALTSRVYE